MSTYGRDSWAPDAMFREQRVLSIMSSVTANINPSSWIVGQRIASRRNSWRRSHQVQQWKMELSGIYLFLTPCNLIESHKVCPQRPVFDTIAILSIHRNGRKHKTVLERILAQKNKGKRNALDEDADAVGPKRASLKRKSISGAQEAPLVSSTRNTVTAMLKPEGVQPRTDATSTRYVSPQTAASAPTISPNLYQQINPSAPPSADATPYYCYYPGPYYPYYPYSYGNYYYPAQVSAASDLCVYLPFYSKEAQPEEPAPPCSAPQQAHSTTQEATTSSVGEEERPQKKRKEEDDPPTEKEKIYYEKLRQLGWLR